MTPALRRLPLLLALAAGSVLAEPPPGHPDPEQSRRYLGLPAPRPAGELPYEGVVLQATEANQYTYIEVQEGELSRWIAAPKIALAPGTRIRYDEGRLMTNFFSRKLRRTFETLTFVGRVEPVAER
jgi:hypothetical protein